MPAVKLSKPRYYVYTWDTEKQDWTPQAGIRCGPYSLFGLRRPLRALWHCGYDTHRRSAFSVLVQKQEKPNASREAL